MQEKPPFPGRSPSPARTSDARVEALLRAGAPAEVAGPDARFISGVMREIRAREGALAARSLEPSRGSFLGSWRGLAGALAAAAIGLVMLLSVPGAAPPRHLDARLARLSSDLAPRSVLASARFAQRPLEREAQRLRTDVQRGLRFIRQTLAVTN